MRERERGERESVWLRKKVNRKERVSGKESKKYGEKVMVSESESE